MPPLATLSIFKLAPGYFFQFQPADGAATLFAAAGSLPTGDQNLREQFAQLTHLLNQVAAQQPTQTHEGRDPLLSLGRLIYNQLFPPSVQQALQALPAATPLVIATNEPEIPWELAHDNQNYLALHFNLARQNMTAQLPRLNPASSSRPSSSLLIGNPTGDLPETSQEIRQLDSLLRAQPGAEPPRFFLRQRATKATILQELAGGAYNLIHFSGHALFLPQQPAASGLILANGEVLTAAEIERNLRGHPFVFLNACDSGRDQASAATASTPDDFTYLGTATQGLAKAFIQGGAGGVLGTFWPVLDASSHEFALTFYRALVQGESIGAALRLTRTRSRQDSGHDPLWASYVLYGQPTLRFPGFARQEPRRITVLQTRLSGLVELFAANELAVAAAIEQQLHQQLFTAAQAYGGQVFTGQTGWLTVQFGAPTAYEDSTARALRTALALRTVVETFNQAQGNDFPQPLALAVGVSSGQALTQPTGTEPNATPWITSNVTAAATRLVVAARDSAIWVDELTYQQTQAEFTFGPPPSASASTAEQVAGYPLLGLRPPLATPTGPMAHAFVGRETELAQLQSWWREAVAGQGRLVSLTGAPGVGKSRLVAALRATLAQQPHHWLVATCHADDQTHLYSALAQLIRAVADIMAEDGEETQRHKLEQVARETIVGLGQTPDELLPDTLALLGEAVNLPWSSAAIARLEPKLRQQRLIGVIQALLRYQTGQQPLVIVLEDLHWADEASLAVLRPLVQQVGQLRALVLLVHRSEWSPDWTASAAYRTLALDTLAEAACDRLLTQLLGAAAQPELAQAIWRRTGGNPFFIAEIVSSLQENQLLVRHEQGWLLKTAVDRAPLPATLEETIQARIDGLLAPSREVLYRAAVIGPEVELPVLEQVQEDSVRPHLESSLHELTRRDFLQAAFGFSITYAFRHTLIQESVYARLLDRYRRALHRLVAQALQGLPVSQKVEKLAYHYYHSDDRVNALHYSLQAAQQALATWANATARQWCDRALEQLQSFASASPTEFEEEQGATPAQLLSWRVTTLTLRAAAQAASGANTAAIVDYIQAIKLATNATLFPATQRADLYRQLAIAHHDKGELDEAWAALEQGLTLVGEIASVEASRLHIWQGMILVRRGQFAEGLAAYQLGMELAGAAQLIQDLSKAYNLLGVIYRRLGRTADAIAALEANIARCQSARYLPGLARAYSNLGCVYQDLGRWDEVLTYGQKSADLCQQTGDVRQQASVAIDLGEIYRRRGQLAEALIAYTQAQQIGEQFEFPEIVGMALLNQAATHLRRADLATAERCLVAGEAILQQNGIDQYTPEVLRLQAELSLQQGQLAQALTTAEAALYRATQQGEELEVGIAYRVLGQVYHRLGQMQRAQAELDASLAGLRQQRSPHEVGLTLLELAGLVPAQGEALAFCEEAITIFTGLGATLDLRHAQNLRQRFL